MSRAAYERHFGQPAPPGAYFGVDVSWWNGYTAAVASGYWADFGTWADFVCIRTSFGDTGDDGAQATHFAEAARVGFKGTLGTYHLARAEGVQANFANYIARSDPFVDQTSFDMLDYETAPNIGAAAMNQLTDMVAQRRQRPCNPYSNKGYMDAAGSVSSPAARFWVAHYPAGSADAWSPTTSWSSNGAPLMPNQYGAVHPGCWQWAETSPEHGSLDLDMTTTPENFGLDRLGLGPGNGDGFLATVPQDEWLDTKQKIDTLFWQFGNLKYFEAGSGENSIGFRLARRLDLTEPGATYDFRDLHNNAASNHTMLEGLVDAVAEIAAKLDAVGDGVVDVERLAEALARLLDIEGSTARTVAVLFADLLGAAR